MTNYINTETRELFGEAQIRAAHPNISFPTPFTPPAGFEVVFVGATPTYNAITQRLELSAPVLTSKGHWQQDYTVIELYATPKQAEDAIAAANKPPVPFKVTMRQARLALLANNLLAEADASIAGLPVQIREAAKIEWEFANDVERSSPIVAAMGGALAMTAAELDALFILAATL
jgi:hypothetical protein